MYLSCVMTVVVWCICWSQAYNILRRSSGLLLSLVHLMAGATITDLAADPNKALLKLQVTFPFLPLLYLRGSFCPSHLLSFRASYRSPHPVGLWSS